MMLLSILVAVAITYGVGRLLVKVLGWPRDLDGAMRWAVALVTIAVIYSGFPELWRLFDPLFHANGWEGLKAANLPRVGLLEVLAGFCFVGLSVLGYVGWSRAVLAREDAEHLEGQVRHQARRRALPPAPEDEDDGFHPLDGDG